MGFGYESNPHWPAIQHLYEQAQKERVVKQDLIATVEQLLGVEVRECGEPMVIIPPDIIHTEYRAPLDELRAEHGNKVYVREGVARRLVQTQALLQSRARELQLLVAYGYRTDYLQHKYFVQKLTELRLQSPNIWLTKTIDLAHKWIAFPPIAGHPTGGCVDITIRNRETGEELDMGTPLFCLEDRSSWGYAGLSAEQQRNRELLRSIMETEGFYAYAGEWWHYAYGDREWGFHKGTPAIYEQLPSEALRSAAIYRFKEDRI